jgi:predicted permease
VIGDWLSDVRYAFRALRRAPGFAAAAGLTIGLGIGANTAIFSVINAALLRPLPYPAQDRLIDVAQSWEGSPRARISPAEYFDYQRAAAAELSAFGVYAVGALNLTGTGEPLRIRAGYATAGLVAALGVAPHLGRIYTAAEEAERRDVALISHGLWQRQFGGDPGVVGRATTLNGTATEVVGVLPAGFQLPADFSDGLTTDVIVPLALDPGVTARGSHFLNGVGRLAPGRTRAEAHAALAAVAGRFVRDYPDDYPRDMALRVTTQPLARLVVGDARRPLFLLLGAAVFVLLIACANVANLMLVRLDARRAELAVRTALGANRGRLVRQLLVESLILGLAGGAVGVALAWGGLQGLLALRPPDLPRFGEVTVDGRVLAFAAAVAIGAGMLFGLLPALRASGARLAVALRAGARGTVAGANRGRQTLVVGQIAAALTLLAGAGLLGRSLMALVGVDPGFRDERVLTGRLSLPQQDYPSEAEVIDGFAAVRDRVGAVPGVQAVGGVSTLPLAASLGDLNFQIEGRETRPDEVSSRADWQVVTPGYFAAMGLALLRGRVLDERDREGAPGAVVISQTTAQRYWPGQDPLGARMVLGGGAGPGLVTVVGIVGDVRHASLAEGAAAQMYLSHAQFRFWNGGSVVRALTLAVRAAGDPAALAAAVRGAVFAFDPRIPLADVRTMRDVVARSLGRERFVVALAAAFAAVALALGTLGIYGVLAYVVAQRTRELGLRLALGAEAREVASMVLRDAGRMLVPGVALGLGGALVLARVLRGMLYGVTPLDPITLVAAPLALTGAALMASWLPAWRATRISPVEALRHE